jgi:hypothetical protein
MLNKTTQTQVTLEVSRKIPQAKIQHTRQKHGVCKPMLGKQNFLFKAART